MAHLSDSIVQREAEALIRQRVADAVGKPLAPARVKLDSGASVEVDAMAPDGSVFGEIFARQGALKGGQRHKVAADALKLITLGRTRPSAELFLAFADEQAAAYASKGTWLSEALVLWNVKVLVVDLDETVRDGIRAAQLRQVMVNPTASDTT